jgi:hypothetical protein
MISSSVQNQQISTRWNPIHSNNRHISFDYKGFQATNVDLIFFPFRIFHFTSQSDSLLHRFRAPWQCRTRSRFRHRLDINLFLRTRAHEHMYVTGKQLEAERNSSLCRSESQGNLRTLRKDYNET